MRAKRQSELILFRVNSDDSIEMISHIRFNQIGVIFWRGEEKKEKNN